MSRLLGIFCFALLLIGCDALDELGDRDITKDFPVTFTVALPENTSPDPTTFSETATVDLTVNNTINDNIDRLEDVRVTGLTISFENYTGSDPVTLTNLELFVAGQTYAFPDTDIQMASEQGTSYDVDNDELFDAMELSLENSATANYTLSGTADNGDAVSFDVVLNLVANVRVGTI